jgi:hypothetical protein
MDFTYIDEGINAVVIDNFFNENQLKEIMTELKWLTKESVLVGERQLDTAENEYGALASKSGVFLESVFNNWRHSALISSSVHQMNSKEFHNGLMSHNELYKTLFYCNHRSHLLSYYQNADYYGAHCDASFYTMLSYFHTEPKKFKGGEIILSSYTQEKKATIEIKPNRIVLITSNTWHEVAKLESDANMPKYSGDGRYCNAIFLTRIDDKQWVQDPNGGGKYIDNPEVGKYSADKVRKK